MIRIMSLFVVISLVISASASAQSLERISAAKVVHIGYIDGQAPFAAKGADGVPVGYAIDLCNEIASALAQYVPGIKAAYVQTTLTDGFHDVVDGKIDLLCGAVTATLSRRNLVDFSEPFFITGIGAVLRTDSPEDVRDLILSDRRVSPPRSPMLRAFATHVFGVRAGSTAEKTLRTVMQIEGGGATILNYDTHEAGIAALEAREIDAYFADRGLLIGLLLQNQLKDLFLADRWFTHEPYGIALMRGDTDLRLLVDLTLSRFYKTPAFVATLGKYFGNQAPAIAGAILAQSLPE